VIESTCLYIHVLKIRHHFTEELNTHLKTIQGYIDSIFISYVILPSKTNPTIEVGGYKSPKICVSTFNFLREIANYFSYITASTYLEHSNRKSEKILVDSFRGKLTHTWENFVDKTSPVVYPHGDECNVYISTADLIAFLTDKKLYDNHLRLDPADIREIWTGYSFDVDVRFLDAKMIPQIKWVSNELIDTTRYHAKPTIFLNADVYPIAELKKSPVYAGATLLARDLNGCLQGFDKKTDSGKVRDGDVFIYAGTKAKETAMTLTDMYEIEIMSFKDLIKRKS